MFINDITHVVKHCHIRLFADDTCLYITVDDKETAAEHINSDLLAISDWSNKWLVSFSPPKTESMIMGTRPNPDLHPVLFLQNTPIVNVKRHKHVGLWLESNLWWNFHIDEVNSKALKRLNILEAKFYKFKLNRKTLEKMYFVFIRPIVEYADVVWSGHIMLILLNLILFFAS